MLKSAKVETKKEHQVLMVNKTTSFKKGAREREGTSKIMASKLPLDHSVDLKTEPKNHTENKPNRTDFMVFMVSGFGMV